MTEPRFPLAGVSDPELERALFDLGQRLAYPATPDIAGHVRAHLEVEPEPGPHRARIFGHPSRRVWLAAAALLVAILAGLVLFPEARTAIADRLGLRGVVIRWVDEVPTPEPSPVGAMMMLGQQVTMEEAQAAVDFPLLLPSEEGFDNPSEVYLLGAGDGAMVSFVYPARAGLPASEFTGVGALLTQIDVETERGFVEKGLAAKGVDLDTILDYVTVSGNRGYWITGAPHGYFLVCGDDGECREERYRLAGNVLLWEQGGLTLRLESALSRDEALAIAESVRAVE